MIRLSQPRPLLQGKLQDIALLIVAIARVLADPTDLLFISALPFSKPALLNKNTIHLPRAKPDFAMPENAGTPAARAAGVPKQTHSSAVLVHHQDLSFPA